MAASDLVITNVRLPAKHLDQDYLWTIRCANGRVVSIANQGKRGQRRWRLWNGATSTHQRGFDAEGGLLLPSFCHAHIHLDKCFLLDRCFIVSGEFDEALKVTNQCKAFFPTDPTDLAARGERLIRESISYGVTAMRAHVEVDTVVRFACLDVACALKERFRELCTIQIAAFAQEPLFTAASQASPGENYALVQEAAALKDVSAVGSAPYVERTVVQAKQNISLIMDLAARHRKHVDFHLDYNLDENTQPLVYEVISQARARSWNQRGGKRLLITIGHATQLQLLDSEQWKNLGDAMKMYDIHLVSLPQSDIYMQGRQNAHSPLGAPRGTLRVPQLWKNHRIPVAMSVNNVANAFTPQGSLDPLSLCTFGVAIFQSATLKDIRILTRSVTEHSRRAIGQETAIGLGPLEGSAADFVILHGPKALQEAVLYPCYDRTTIRAGVVVATRRTQHWVLGLRKDSLGSIWNLPIKAGLLFTLILLLRELLSQRMPSLHAFIDSFSTCMSHPAGEWLPDKVFQHMAARDSFAIRLINQIYCSATGGKGDILQH